MTEEHDHDRIPFWWLPYASVAATAYALSVGPLHFIVRHYIPKDGHLYHALLLIHWPIGILMYGIGADEFWRDYISWWVHLDM